MSSANLPGNGARPCALALMFASLIAGCATAASNAASPAASPHAADAHAGEAHGPPWFAGTVEQAFAEARATGKPVFLYWGAVWCPPCRALKAEVFPTPRFHELMKAFIPVYLDGDAPAAQTWADKLGVSSYPAMLVVDGDGGERLRMLGAADLAEVDAALTTALSVGDTFRTLVRHAMVEPARVSDGEWGLLSLATWDDPALFVSIDASLHPDPAITLGVLLKLTQLVPARLPEAAARLAGSLLELGAIDPSPSDPARAKLVAEVRAACPRLFDAMLASEATVIAARRTLTENAVETVDFCHPPPLRAEVLRLVVRLLNADEQIVNDARQPAETRLAAAGARCKLYGKGPVPPPRAEEAKAAVARAMTPPPDEAIRHTVVVAAAEALDACHEYAAARELLLAELPRSRVPWYLQSDLSEVAAHEGKVDEALKWAAEAVRSAEGSATRIQWQVSEIKQLVKLKPEARDDELVPRVRAIHELVISLPDGFAGRNRRRLRTLVGALEKVRARPAMQASLVEDKARCAALDGPRRAACDAHFDALLSPPAPTAK